MPCIVHCENSVNDTERAQQFYSTVFGWELQEREGDDIVFTTGIGCEADMSDRILKRRESITGHINTVEVPSVDEYATRVTSNGGTVIIPKIAISGVGYVLYCKDTEDSIFGLFEKEAK